MKHEIDLKNKNIHTDLLVEQIDNDNKNVLREEIGNTKITTINMDDKLALELGKKVGIYITIEFKDVTDIDNREEVGKILVNNIKKILKVEKIDSSKSCLVIGLGNVSSTPDALGPKTIDKILITRHLFLLNELKEGIRNISGFAPNVMANTGIETYDIIRGIVSTVKPDFIVVIDSLRASSIDRINKTIQITNTGINPGSGIGNNRMEISKNTLGIPVIALGVPTVVDSSTIVSDTITYLFKHLSYIKDNSASSKLVFKRTNYLEKIKNKDLTDEEKVELFGLIGSLSEESKYSLIKEVLEGIDYDLIVTPKEIDFMIDKLSEVIASSLNNALSEEVDSY